MSGDTHVVPVGDLVAHELDAGCVCGPDVELVRRVSGGDGWLLVHHALDGRELSEVSGNC